MSYEYRLPHSGRPDFFDPDAKSASTLKIDKQISELDLKSFLYTLPGISEVEVDSDSGYYESCNGVLYSKGMEKLVWYPPKKQDVVFVVPDSVKVICEDAICGQNLKHICGGSGICAIDSRFCSIITIASLDKFDIQSGAFSSVNGVLYNKAMSDLIACPSKVFCNVESDRLRTIKQNALSMNQRISHITLGEHIQNVESGAFLGSSIVSLSGGFGLRSIGVGAFADCKKLETAVLQEGLISIGAGAFNNCRRLKELLIPKTVTSIGFDRSYSTISKKTTILCERGTYAEAYAREHDHVINYI